MKYLDSRKERDLNGAVVAVVGEAEGTEGTIRAVKAVHVALAFVGVGMQLALHEEAGRQQRPEPWRPPVVFVRPSSSLFQSQSTHIPQAYRALKQNKLIQIKTILEEANTGTIQK